MYHASLLFVRISEYEYHPIITECIFAADEYSSGKNLTFHYATFDSVF